VGLHRNTNPSYTRTDTAKRSVGRARRPYRGETANSFQYRDLSARRYVQDDNWLESHKGFPIKIARDVANALERLHIKKLTAVLNDVRNSWPAKWSLFPGFCFRAEEISENTGLDESIVRKVLLAFAVEVGDRNNGFKSLNDFNVANATPLLRRDDQLFVHFLERVSKIGSASH
jgi:hypothetical protein